MSLSTPALAALFALAAACAPAGTQEDVEDAEGSALTRAERLGQGETMAETLCAACHSVGTEGDSPHVDAPPFRQFSWRYPVEDLAEAFAEGIMVGHPDTPEWQFEPNDIDALLAYIESIQ